MSNKELITYIENLNILLTKLTNELLDLQKQVKNIETELDTTDTTIMRLQDRLDNA